MCFSAILNIAQACTIRYQGPTIYISPDIEYLLSNNGKCIDENCELFIEVDNEYNQQDIYIKHNEINLLVINESYIELSAYYPGGYDYIMKNTDNFIRAIDNIVEVDFYNKTTVSTIREIINENNKFFTIKEYDGNFELESESAVCYDQYFNVLDGYYIYHTEDRGVCTYAPQDPDDMCGFSEYGYFGIDDPGSGKIVVNAETIVAEKELQSNTLMYIMSGAVIVSSLILLFFIIKQVKKKL